eukprot:TRINITY_DN1319_c0_g1_i2.p1 TRINITY_DN1319_c0_g1~~TRINITY_DN1319_c0_g1_i2.p1  ORF type:complete len:104 (+),score=54.69 TRINITY_DN1319_c0_g1_i2:40-351(+)
MSADGSENNNAPSETGIPKTETAEHINVRVCGQDGSEVFFKIKKTTPFRKLMEAYCQRQGKSINSVRFLYDGDRITEGHTPKELGMQDNDMIDALLQQTGGSQ